MWTISYSRIDVYNGLVTNQVQTQSRLKALFFYYWWSTCFTLNVFSTKQVSLYLTENGVVSFKSKKGMIQNAENLRRMRCKEVSKRHYF
jgi:hypothetical protein